MRQTKTYRAEFRHYSGGWLCETQRPISATSLKAAKAFAKQMIGRVENCDFLVGVYLEKGVEHEQEAGWDSIRRGLDAEVGQG